MKTRVHQRVRRTGDALLCLLAICSLACALLYAKGAQAVICGNGTPGTAPTITANVVVLDNPTVFNRLGAQNPNWITYALKRDVVFQDRANPGVPGVDPGANPLNGTPCTQTTCTAGNAELRPDKRPRPLVIRSVAGSCLTVTFTNWLTLTANLNDVQQGPAQGQPGALFNDDQVAGRCAGFHASGTELVTAMADDGSMVGNNPGADTGDSTTGAAVCGPGLAAPDETRTYNLYTPHEGAYIINSYGATLGSEANSGNLAVGMFGALNVEPPGARLYRSQVTEEELRLSTVGTVLSDCPSAGVDGIFGTTDDQPLGLDEVVGVTCNPGGQPIIDYEANYPAGPFLVAPVQEVQTIVFDATATGTLTLAFGADTTAALPGVATAGAVETALNNLPSIQAAGGVTVTGDPGNFTVQFTVAGPMGALVAASTLLDSLGNPVNVTVSVLTPGVLGVDNVWFAEGKAGLPILNMLCNAQAVAAGACLANEYVHSDINAIIAGSCTDGSWKCTRGTAGAPYPLEQVGMVNPVYPNRLEPFREFTSVFHDEQTNSQVFPEWYGNPVLNYTLAGVKDQFMINYGSGGIGSEIIANRLRTGPMHDCTNCAYEEFFLSSSTVGDPGMLVNFPANSGIEACDPTNIGGPACWRDPVNLANGPIPFNFALYQEDPANVHHAYTGDHLKVRNTHAGAFEQHIFHQHNHQWLFNPNDDNANYLDAQEIMPGSGHTYEYVYGGAGNRNKTVGDAIFHCHFYPHFAQGMWYHLRNHDVFEKGTVLAVSAADDPQNPTTGFHAVPFDLRSGQPAVGARALPDGELPDGSPIPAVVPLPGKPMPQMPATVSVAAVDRGGYSLGGGRTPPDGIPDSAQAVVDRASVAGVDTIPGTADDVSPGYPFWLAGNECGIPTATNACPQGIVGQRMPTPPLDMLTEAGASANGYNPAQAGGSDGGLPRHALLGYTAGGLSADTQNRLDFRKVVERAQPVYFPELGSDLEQVSMAYQSVRERPSAAQQLAGLDVDTAGVHFVLNGAMPVPGGPYNDPCVDDAGTYLGLDVAGQWFDGIGGNSVTGTSTYHGDNPRTYKIANIQIDAVFNKVGHHYPQERIIALWEDVAPTIGKLRPPEPLVMRFNTFDCGKLLHTNLVPAEFELDDFQVRTPTDIIGQHIHLPKWDLTSNDGAANGWNYEDGTLAPGAIQERIHAIDVFNLEVAAEIATPGTHPDLAGLAPVATLPNPCGDDGTANCGTPGGLFDLVAQPHPFFGAGVGDEYLGARTTIQRMMIDPVVNVAGIDRGLGLTFSHDHYGPSSFQQIGLYSTILAEPAGSTWVHNESGEVLGTRDDGGPTSWQAAIITPAGSPVPDHREFYFEISDFQHAYNAGVYVGADANGRPVHSVVNQADPFNVTQATAPALADTWQQAVNPPLKLEAMGGFPDVVTAPAQCPGGVPRPCPEAINISHSSTWVVNYRNEPVGLRVYDPAKTGPDGNPGSQAGGLNALGVDVPPEAGDLAFALQTRSDRAIPQLNTAVGDTPYPVDPPYCNDGGDFINCDRQAGDPFTPIMRTYELDQVKIKIQVGATEEQHQATVHGVKWLSNGSGFGRSPNSGWRGFQSHGISEQFTLQVPVSPDAQQAGNRVDYLYATDATRDGFWLGTWGVLRSYGTPRNDLVMLPDNAFTVEPTIVNRDLFNGVCPLRVNRRGRPSNQIANLVEFDVTAVLANEVLPNAIDVAAPLGTADITISPNTQITDLTGAVLGGDSDGDGMGDNAGGPLDPAGGTLVYNRRGSTVTGAGAGPLNDPTAILYVRTEDLVFDLACATPGPNDADPNLALQRCRTALGDPVGLQPGVPVEPLVLRANAGACIQTTLRNALPFTPVDVMDPGPDGIAGTADDQVIAIEQVPDPMPDLAGWQDLMGGVTRRIEGAGPTAEMYFFNNNLIRPSSYVGLHAQLVEYDVSRDDGVPVGRNPAGQMLAAPGGQKTIQWYAGDLRQEEVTGGFEIVATPVEFGASNLLSADRVKQPQKGLFGALVIEPEEATWPDALAVLEDVPDNQGMDVATRKTRAQLTVTAPPGDAGSGGTYREALAMGHRITNLRWADGSAVRNIHQNELGREGAEDSGHAGFNYAMEPSWFRFGLPPDADFGNAGTPGSFGSIPNVQAFYANALVALEPNTIPDILNVSVLGDPVTPVFRATAAPDDPSTAEFDTRMYVLNGASADRDGTFILHGHLWQRDPFVCTGASQDSSVSLEGRCDPDEPVPSQALGLNPQAKWMASEEGMGHAYGHWPILFDAGGTNAVTGDYLYRDYSPGGNRNGQFGLLRVAEAGVVVNPCTNNQPPAADIVGPNTGRIRDRLTWDGSGSTDPDGDTLSYAWTLTDSAGQVRATGTEPTFTVRIGRRWPTGNYTVTLTVTDPCGATDTAFHTVLIN